MTDNTSGNLTLPVQQYDLFLANILDVAPKGDMKTMEYPLFSLATKPDTEIYRYEGKENWIEVIPSVQGRATIFDKDLILYCIGQLKAGQNQGRTMSRIIRVTAHDFLIQTGRNTGGHSYELLFDSLVRLRGTTFKTDLMGGAKRGRVFGLIEQGEVGRKDEKGRFTDMNIVLSEWLYDAVKNNDILTYNRQYYDLRKPNERRMYEICRKHCGNQEIWHIHENNLFDKFGTRGSIREFRRSLRSMIERQSLPDYLLALEDSVLFVTQRS